MPELAPFDVLEKLIFEDNNDVNLISNELEENQLPIFPEFRKGDEFHSVDIIDKWSIFRLYPIIEHGRKTLEKLSYDIFFGNTDVGRTKIPTLYAYYHTLPE